MGKWKWIDGEKLTHKELIRADLELGDADSILYHGSDWPMNESDAKLIAAAPEIKEQRDELLKVVQNFFEWQANHFEEFDDEVNGQLLCLANEAEQAIAKAEA